MDHRNAWQAAVGQLQMEMSRASYETWVQPAELVRYENDLFTVGVPNAYACDWLKSRLTAKLNSILSGIMECPQKVEFIVWHKDYENQPQTASTAEPLPLISPAVTGSQPVVNHRYNFDNFVVGSSNRLAHAACLAVAENPAQAYNPLFLYGGVGLGKTHLLHAIGNFAQARGEQVLYVSSEEFTNDLINAIRTHTTQAFRDRYRRIDVLLVDDIQFIAGKESTQEEFFHTFNTLHGQDKQIVISSDRPPKAMNTLEERLRSRFEWGLTADIQPPDLETRIAILRSKAERSRHAVPPAILEIIARQFQSNIRELEGALTRVVAYADLRGRPLSEELVNVALTDLLPQRNAFEPAHVVNVVASAFGITPEKLMGRDRTRAAALPRQVVMYLLRQEANVSLPQIGEAMGGRDHTTVMYACEKVADMIERDDRLRRQVLQIREQLYGRKTT
ncbi:MAG TPA: chromosomal replication initiator protein DnaA [Anaerolineaceae bacterium]|nr:chromosomal replication initiator protein DnaA [Anaerolineaceae bacterium]HOS53092.1 chromosomal replication initiator protein DnaA [Anaerolineaceae bacterium]HPD63015.1 chromosomal replication initiator protein DnaA [Anaerolineaceae bacterium]HQF68510.1 chromosomal replication initiator protein DnaA [Anaerolineaceae bacterium]HRS73477.1 chromosomal replication initiator protein DnaA [Anaerolineaceae bacterium]